MMIWGLVSSDQCQADTLGTKIKSLTVSTYLIKIKISGKIKAVNDNGPVKKYCGKTAVTLDQN